MAVTTSALSNDAPVLDGIHLTGNINTPDAQLLANITHSIRLGYPQIRMQAIHPERAVVVGGGPSLNSTFDELRDLVFQGAKLVTLNGAYQWCLERNLRPSAQIVLDARPGNGRFLSPAVPRCKYLIASQCHPETWAAVAGRPNVWIWHSMAQDSAWRGVLDAYYAGNWHGIAGGTTVAMRALVLLRTIGFLRFDFFGIDSCWLDDQHHAFDQPENEVDKKYVVYANPTGYPERKRQFVCSPWHLQQLDDFLRMIRVNGDQFLVNVHGDGLLAYALQSSADLTIEQES